MIAITVEGVVGGKLKQDRQLQVDIARDGDPATIIPFAQGEMVTRFMEGIDPAFLDYLGDTMGEASTQVVMEALKGFGVECTEDEEQAVRQAAHEQTAHYLKETARFRYAEFVTPIMEIVQQLPEGCAKTDSAVGYGPSRTPWKAMAEHCGDHGTAPGERTPRPSGTANRPTSRRFDHTQ